MIYTFAMFSLPLIACLAICVRNLLVDFSF